MDTAVVGAFLRQLLTIGGTYAASKGWLDGSMIDQLIGAVTVIGSFGWSIIQKKQAKKLLETAERAPPIVK